MIQFSQKLEFAVLFWCLFGTFTVNEEVIAMWTWFKKHSGFEKFFTIMGLLSVGFAFWIASDMMASIEEQRQDKIDWRISQLSSKEAQGAIVFHEVEEKLLLVQSDENLVVFFTTDTGNHAPYNFNALIVKKDRDRKWFDGIVKVVRPRTLEYSSAKKGFTVAAFDKMKRNK